MINNDYLFKLKEELDKSRDNNFSVNCVVVNPQDYNNYIVPIAKAACKFNYEPQYFGNIELLMFDGIKILVSTHVPEGYFFKSSEDLTAPLIESFTNQSIIDIKNFK